MMKAQPPTKLLFLAWGNKGDRNRMQFPHFRHSYVARPYFPNGRLEPVSLQC